MRLFGKRQRDDGPEGLPADGDIEIAGVKLRGARMRAELDGTGPAVLWRTEGEPERVFSAWRRLAGAHAETGLWPVLITHERLDLGHFDPAWEDTVAAVDYPAMVAERWVEHGSYDEELRELMGDFPGLAAPGTTPADDPLEHVFATVEVHSLGLVPVRRPADVLAAIGWTGAINSFEPVELVPYLRSFEERFDARLVALGFDTVQLAVGRPPASAEAIKAASELYLFNPDVVDQGVGTIEALAEEMVQDPHWAFWWD
ncbi:DUF4253 domain-containing protein [Solirubrobacter sp. CPCC 204708]|uniref:DUF4253 domain-containing protein n=1 Tax=Solirubrobacter deserti TaxID=2282478 RepID=A0ABT4RGL9_9ACTN|nr:DUF4253 domain-containing protein [Solirubrobacter deserti]MBE2319592.1 DUF4253 domain-containing protein [Solirubrobacter deserti]MDA0137669.1 DUF4253 domain-containing protein [Solirubrobacter deserti]